MKSLQDYSKIQVLDFEFQQQPGHQPTAHCCVVHEMITGQTARVWLHPSDNPTGECPYSSDEDTLLLTYFGSAEAQCLLALGWSLPRNHIDLYAEFRCLTNGRALLNGKGLLGALSYFNIDTMGVAEKEEMRTLAIRGGPFSDAERKALLDYCQADVEGTAKLAQAMLPKINLPHALIRGRYVNTIGEMEANGIPVDAATLKVLQERWPEIVSTLIQRVNATYGVYEGRTFKNRRWLEWTQVQGIDWPRHASGAPVLDRDTFSDMARLHPEILPMKELRTTLSQTRIGDLPVGPDGRNRTLLSPFSSRTGRNQPKSSKLIFGPAKWMRGLIRPEQGKALAYLDYEQQEFGIAAALSSDSKMRTAYRTGDPYLSFAKQAGAVPTDATQESHPRQRELFKSCALGVQYGMGIDSLAAKTRQSIAHARQLYDLHRETYPNYWAWSQGVQDSGVLNGGLEAAFGWQVKVEGTPNGRFLRNFPLQANGAEMLRLACILASEAEVKLCAPVHDALLIEADDDLIDEHVQRCKEAMTRASEIVLLGFQLRVEHHVIRFPEHFPVGNGQAVWDEVNRLLGEL